MSNTPKDSSEKAFQEKFVRELTKYRWEDTEELNGNTHKVTVDTLIQNWRAELNRLNAEKLEGVPLTDNEFEQVLTKVSGIRNSYEAAKLLAAENGKGKIDGIFRDQNPHVTQKQITLTIFRKAEIIGGDSRYQIAREVVTPKGNRFDIVLLFCGLPLINIEMKRSDKSIDNAWEQFRRYYEDGEYIGNFMAFSQMMVITSEIATEYFATPKNLKSFNRVYSFHWSDAENRIINKWDEVIEKFLYIPMAHQMVGDYLVINEAENEDERCHMLMRPYQVYALQSVEIAVLGRDDKDNIPHGGFVWHTTGSGKTITSFKTVLFLSTKAGFDKIVFLVDRRELDDNTFKRFNAYSVYESVDVDNTEYTHNLKSILKSPKRGIVVTTTFKLNVLVKELLEKKDTSLDSKRFVFIIDEAHRTTMGEMMVNITSFFKKKGIFFGFTGTPLFDQNKVQGMKRNKIDEHGKLVAEAINTTEKLFGPCLHKYTIDEAIRDRNVLGFHVDFMNTGEFRYDSLRQKITEYLLSQNSGMTKHEAQAKTATMNDVDLERKGKELGFIKYNDELHIPRVVEDIIENWERQSQKRNFNSILTTGRIDRALKYLEEFKKQQKDSKNPIHIALTISFGSEEEDRATGKEQAEIIFKQYESFTGRLFKFGGDKNNNEQAYFEDLISRFARGGSGRNEKNIDLVIVADQLLTGYDSKYLNTLYVDRTLELQGLVQAYSRTNRLYGKEKEFGTIINYQYPALTEESVNEALKLYGSGGTSSIAIVDTYEVAVAKLNALIYKMKTSLPEPSKWASLKTDENAMQNFKDAYKKANAQMTKVSQYYECKWDDETFGINKNSWNNYTGAYKNLFPKDPPPQPSIIPYILEDETTVAITMNITAGYILKLIGEKATKRDTSFSIDTESMRLILEKIQEFSDKGNAEQSELLKEFVQDIYDGKIDSGSSAEKTFFNWKKVRLLNEIEKFASEWGCNSNLLLTALQSYNPQGNGEIPLLDEIIDSVDLDSASRKFYNAFEHNMQLSESIEPWLTDIKRIYLES